MERSNRHQSFIFWLIIVIFGLICLGVLVSGAAFADGEETDPTSLTANSWSQQGQVITSQPSSPAAQFDDLACRLCHGDSEKEINFPSGETLPVQVDMETVDHSVHGTQAEEPLGCTDCHQPVNDYKFPHTPVESFDYRGYQLQNAVNCERCHVQSHLTSHESEGETAVSCTDCHGSHDVTPIDAGIDTATCETCHEEADVETAVSAELTTLIENGLFAEKANDSYCLACHDRSDIFMAFDNGDSQSISISADALNDSVHGADNSWQPLACADCHQQIEAFPHEPIEVATARDYHLEKYTQCIRCHEQNYDKSVDSVHGAAIEEGNSDAAVCTDCHGAHDTPVPDEPRERISHTCEQCHSEIFNEYATSIHGDALLSESNPDVPTCINCHGVHDINDPSTNLARLRSPQLCADCHADEELMSQYEISTEVFDTYVADFHGTTVALFEHQDPTVETNKAVCYDCHGVHNIKATDDPHAGIKDNLLVTCQECHPDATANFSDAWTSHFQPSLEHNPLVYLVNLFYQIVIPLTIGFFAFLILTDIYRRVRERLQATRS